MYHFSTENGEHWQALTWCDKYGKQAVHNAIHDGFYFRVFNITFVYGWNTASRNNFY